MLKLTPRTADLETLEVAKGVSLTLKPVTVAAMMLGSGASAAVYEAAAKAEEPPESAVTTREAVIALVRKVVHVGLVSWDGVGDADGNPAPVTTENVDLLLDYWPVHDKLDREYVYPAMVLDLEKNG